LAKNISIGGYRLYGVWNTGLVIIILIIGAGFSGYVLVGRQIRFWAAIVITSLISVIPFMGETLIFYIWGGYSISWVTLQILTVLHFILPFIVIGVMIIHLHLLHNRGRTSVILYHGGLEKITFFPYYWVKDLINVVFYLIFILFILLYPYSLGEVELFEEANPINSPVHIVPEWYFLRVYAILRRVPSKGIGVLIIMASIIVLFLYPLRVNYTSLLNNVRNRIFIFYIIINIILRYLGIAPISYPFTIIRVRVVRLYILGHFALIIINLCNRLIHEVTYHYGWSDFYHSLTFVPHTYWAP
jgi:ubiquinol-cytochrome c reductase cytochrome b subunit